MGPETAKPKRVPPSRLNRRWIFDPEKRRELWERRARQGFSERRFTLISRTGMIPRDSSGRFMLPPDVTLERMQQAFLANPPRMADREEADLVKQKCLALGLSRRVMPPQPMIDDAVAIIRSEDGEDAIPTAVQLRVLLSCTLYLCRQIETALRLAASPPNMEDIKAQLGTTYDTAVTLVEIGLIKEEPRQGRARRFDLPPDTTFTTLRRDFQARDWQIDCERDVTRYIRGRSALGLSLEPHTPSALAAMIRLLDGWGVMPSVVELLKLAGGDKAGMHEALVAYAATGRPVATRRAQARKGDGSFANLRRMVPDDLPLVGTAVDALEGSTTDMPPESEVATIEEIDHPQLRNAALIVATHGRSAGFAKHRVTLALRALRYISPMMSGVRTDVALEVGAVLRPYLAAAKASKAVSYKARLQDMVGWRDARRIIASFIRKAGDRGATLHKHQIALPNGSESFFREVWAEFVREKQKSLDAKAKRIAKLMDAPEWTFDVACQRADRAAGFAEEVRRTIAWAEKHGQGNCVHWTWKEEFLDLENGLEPVSQIILFSIRLWQSIHDTLRLEGAFTEVKKLKGDNPEDHWAVIIENVVPCTIGGPTSRPFYQPLAEAGFFDASTMREGGAATRAVAEHLRRLDYKPAAMEFPRALVRFRGRQRSELAGLWRRSGRTPLIPVLEIDHGLAFAAFGLSARYDQPLRATDVEQIRVDNGDENDPNRAEWWQFDDPETGDEYHVYQTVPKWQKKLVDRLMHRDTVVRMARMLRLTSLRCHDDDGISISKPSLTLQDRGMGEDWYALTYDGRVIDQQSMLGLTRFLLIGVVALKAHDTKDQWTVIGRRQGMTEEQISRAHDHRSVSALAPYGHGGERSRVHALGLIRAVVAKRRVGHASAAPTAIDEILGRRNELIRERIFQTALANLFEKHDRRTEAAAARDAAQAATEALGRLDEEGISEELETILAHEEDGD